MFAIYRVLDFFEEKIIIDKNLTILNLNCDSLQLHFLKNIYVVLCLTFCNLSVSTFLIYSFSITFICLSPWISAKHFTASRWSRASESFLNHYIRVVVSGKRVNKGTGLGLEIPVDYFYHGDIEVIERFKKSIEKLDKCADVKVEKVLEII